VKLSVNLVGHGRYWLAGEEVDESIVPPELRKYGIVEGSEGSPMPVAILKRERGRLRQRPAPSSGTSGGEGGKAAG
jgi:hypothetical protein